MQGSGQVKEIMGILDVNVVVLWEVLKLAHFDSHKIIVWHQYEDHWHFTLFDCLRLLHSMEWNSLFYIHWSIDTHHRHQHNYECYFQVLHAYGPCQITAGGFEGNRLEKDRKTIRRQEQAS